MMPIQQRICVVPPPEAIVAVVIGTTFGGCRCMISPQDGHLAAAEPYENDWKYEAVSAQERWLVVVRAPGQDQAPSDINGSV